VDADTGPAFTIENGSNLLLDGVTTAKPIAGSPVVRLTSTPGAILRDSRAFPGNGVFLSTGKGELRSISLSGNAFENAGTPTEER
jgi:hypothetical protein